MQAPGDTDDQPPPDVSFLYRDVIKSVSDRYEQFDLNDVTMMVQDWGGPIGFAVATRHPQRFSAFVIGNTWAWPKRTQVPRSSPDYSAAPSAATSSSSTTCSSRRSSSSTEQPGFQALFHAPGRIRTCDHRIRSCPFAGLLPISAVLWVLQGALSWSQNCAVRDIFRDTESRHRPRPDPRPATEPKAGSSNLSRRARKAPPRCLAHAALPSAFRPDMLCWPVPVS